MDSVNELEKEDLGVKVKNYCMDRGSCFFADNNSVDGHFRRRATCHAGRSSKLPGKMEDQDQSKTTICVQSIYCTKNSLMWLRRV